jgi:hypothetical protein
MYKIDMWKNNKTYILEVLYNKKTNSINPKYWGKYGINP